MAPFDKYRPSAKSFGLIHLQYISLQYIILELNLCHVLKEHYLNIFYGFCENIE